MIDDFSDLIGPAVVGLLVSMLVAVGVRWFRPRATPRTTSDETPITGVGPQAVDFAPRAAKVENASTDIDRRAMIERQEAAMRDFGVVERVGDELRMGWFEHIFTLEKPVAGIDEVWTLNGFASFTSANRCLVVSDGQRLLILDREKDHGVSLTISPSQWFEWSVEDHTVVVACYKGHGGKELEQRFIIEAHTDNNATLVPKGWRWQSTLFPKTVASIDEQSSE